MPDILKNLKKLSFRNITVPMTSRQVGFAQAQVQNKFIFRDEANIESLGKTNLTFSYVIPFRTEIIRGDYGVLFPDKYVQFYVACQNSESGVLNDPILGQINVKAVSWSESLDVNKRDGVDVTVQFIKIPDAVDLGVEVTVSGAIETSRKLKAATQEILDGYGQKPPPKPTTDPLLVIDSLNRQSLAVLDKIDAKYEDVKFKIAKNIDSINKVNKRLNNDNNKFNNSTNNASTRVASSQKSNTQASDNSNVLQLSIDLYDQVIELERKKAKESVQGTIKQYVVESPTTLSLLAKRFNMKVNDFLKLNPRVVGPLVRKGTIIKYIKGV